MGRTPNGKMLFIKDLILILTGEISEHDWHDATEAGIHFFAGGHNATEQFGVQSLMEHVKSQFVTECQFFPSENPA